MSQLPLEDTFGDVLRKSMSGVGLNTAQLASATGVSAAAIAKWLKDEGTADDAQARTLAKVLRLDPGKLADSAAQRWHPPAIERADIEWHA
ncbi:MAG: helix-turn-helix transcriptional regulator, partial [Candidatus Cybelea sp.]